MRRGFLFLLILLLPACGYRWGNGGVADSYATICVPYVEGDDKGMMTDALIHSLAASGGPRLTTEGGDLILKVCLQVPSSTNIGFTYAPEKTPGKFKRNVVSNEARLGITAKVTLVDACAGCTLWGPVKISTALSYDFESDLARFELHEQSLGQLEMNELAKDAAFRPLYQNLAQKIVDYLNHN